MMIKTAFFLLGLLLVASFAPQQALAGVDISAQLSGKIDIETHLEDITTSLDAVLSSILGEPIEIGDVTLVFDTNAFEEGTITYDASLLDDEGLFEGSITINTLSLAASLTHEGTEYSGSIEADFQFTVSVAPVYENDGVSFVFDTIELAVDNLEINIAELPSLVSIALETGFEAFIENAFATASATLEQYGNAILLIFNEPLAQLLEAVPRVTLTISGSVDGFDREDVVAALVDLLADVDAGDFANGVMIGDISAAGEGMISFDFWILDNEDGQTGAQAVTMLQEEYNSNPQAFNDAGLEASNFAVDGSDGGDGESSNNNDGDSSSSATNEDGDGTSAVAKMAAFWL